MKRFLSGVAACLAVLLVLAGCSSTPTGWVSDYEEGQQLASKEGKDLFLFFSSEDTDGVSTQLRSSIFDTESFIKTAGKDYVLVHLDFSESRLMSVQVPEDATDEQKQALVDAVMGCPVKLSLHPDIELVFTFNWAE